MVKYSQKKLWGKIGCSLSMVTGFMGNVAYGSSSNAEMLPLEQFIPQLARGAATEKVLNDPNGDTFYLKAVRIGDGIAVKLFLDNPYLNFDGTDNQGNTDLMLAIKGGDKDEWGSNYRTIFNLIIQHVNRNLNLQNRRGQTALLLAIGWGRIDAIDTLLKNPAVDPNIPNGDGTTPLIAAIGNTFVPLALRVDMGLRLINHPRVNVNQRGTDNKLPLQIAFEAKLLPQFSNLICRRNLIDYDIAVKNVAQTLVQQLNPHIHGQALFMIQNLLRDDRVNVSDYQHCPINELIDAIRRKIHFLLNQLGIDLSALPSACVGQLQGIDANTLLFNKYLQPDISDQERSRALHQLFSVIR
ncbi:MAG: ankyrin repeat domain-containing protein [Puniceicoccales bacterium]|jgi:hypothetical protein|nr:ankyrin repeat domain-containing protein [Puniceicoccales bacterium]